MEGGVVWLLWEWIRYRFLCQRYCRCCKFNLVLEVLNTLLLFDANLISLLWMHPSGSWVSIYVKCNI